MQGTLDKTLNFCSCDRAITLFSEEAYKSQNHLHTMYFDVYVWLLDGGAVSSSSSIFSPWAEDCKLCVSRARVCSSQLWVMWKRNLTFFFQTGSGCACVLLQTPSDFGMVICSKLT
jgi:hypothetical protein